MFMIAEINYWSVTFYGEQESDSQLLLMLCQKAREFGISFGSVGVFPLPVSRSTYEVRPQVFVFFPHYGEDEAYSLLSATGIEPDSVNFKEVVFVTDESPQHKKSLVGI